MSFIVSNGAITIVFKVINSYATDNIFYQWEEEHAIDQVHWHIINSARPVNATLSLRRIETTYVINSNSTIIRHHLSFITCHQLGSSSLVDMSWLVFSCYIVNKVISHGFSWTIFSTSNFKVINSYATDKIFINGRRNNWPSSLTHHQFGSSS